MKLFRAFLCSMILTLIHGSRINFPFEKNRYNKTCEMLGDEGVYTMEKNCDQAKLLSRVGRADQVKYAGVDLIAEEFVVCCIPRVVMVDMSPPAFGYRFSDSEEHCHDYCKKELVVDEHIIGGDAATVGEFMHMAAIGYFNDVTKKIDFNCGGALLSEKFVLTAAHCTNKKTDTPYMVRLGRVRYKYSRDSAN